MRSTQRIETKPWSWPGVLPELSRTMAYTTRKTVNRLARKQSHLNRGVRTTKGGINLYIELEKHKIDQIETLKCLSRQTYIFLEVNYGVTEEKRTRTNMISVIRIYYCTCKQFQLQNKGGKFLKKLWCCVGGEYSKIIWFYQLG